MQKQSAATGKFAVINIDAFSNKENGIKEVADIYHKLEIEFKAETEELKKMIEDYEKLVKEIKELNSKCSRECTLLVDKIQDKLDQHESLKCKVRTKTENVRFLFEKRKAELTADVNKKIAVAVKQFAKEKGYALILDASQKDSLLCQPVDGFVEATNEFTKYYNESFGKVKSQ